MAACNSVGSNIVNSCTGSADAFASCTSVRTLQCFKAVLLKCDEELVRAGEVIGKLQGGRMYPHSGYFQQFYGSPGQVNCRTKDKLASIQGAINRLQPAEMRDIYRANIRFQLSLQHVVLTRHMLTLAVNTFIDKVTDYEMLLAKRGARGSLDESSAAPSTTTTPYDDEVAVSSTTINTPASCPTATELDRQIQESSTEVNNKLIMIQMMLNQLPMLMAPLHVELRLMRIYDNYDDSVIVHQLLTNPAALAMITPWNGGGGGGGNATHQQQQQPPPLMHDWDRLISETAVQNLYRGVGQQRPSSSAA